MAQPNLTVTGVLKALMKVGELLDWPGRVEILLIGGAAGMVTGILRPERTTGDCDVADCTPSAAAAAVERAAKAAADKLMLPREWFNDRAGQMNPLPDGWRSRRRHVATYGKLKVYAAGRADLLAMKVFAHRPTDRHDIADMHITRREIEFVRKYLEMLKVPSRGADLDQLAAAETYLRLLEGQQP